MDRLAEWRRQHANSSDDPVLTAKDGAIDLDEENAAAGLEDPDLLAHMAHAREQYQTSQDALKQVPNEAATRQVAVENIGVLSELLRTLDDEFVKVDTAGSEVHVVGKHLGVWGKGGRMAPLFPDGLGKAALSDPALQKGIAKAQQVLQDDAEAIKVYLTKARKRRQKFEKAHFALIKCWNDFRDICEAQRRTIDAQKRLLAETRAVWDKEQVAAEQSFLEVNRSARAPAAGAPEIAAQITLDASEAALDASAE